MRDDRERLLDILEAIERIEKYTSKGREVFEDDELIQTWVPITLRLLVKPRVLSRPRSGRNIQKLRGQR